MQASNLDLFSATRKMKKFSEDLSGSLAKYWLENIYNCDKTGMYDLEARGQTWSSGRINTFFLKTYQVGLVRFFSETLFSSA